MSAAYHCIKNIDKELELSPKTWQVFLRFNYSTTMERRLLWNFSPLDRIRNKKNLEKASKQNIAIKRNKQCYLLSHFGLPGFLFAVGTGSDWDVPDWRVEEFILESSGWLAGFSRSDNPSKLWISSRRKGPAFRSSAFNNEPACPNHLIPLITRSHEYLNV